MVDMNVGGSGSMREIISDFKDMAKETSAELKNEKLTAQQAVQAAMKRQTGQLAGKVQKKALSKKQQLKRLREANKGKKGKQAKGSKEIDQKAEEFEERNPELGAKGLKLLREYIKEEDSPDDIMEKTLKFYDGDPSLADEALEFLEQTTSEKLSEKVVEAKSALNESKGREIRAGRNITSEAQQAEGIGTPSNLRDMYRKYTGDPKDPLEHFEELTQKYEFKDMQKVIKFLFRAIGSDLNAKGPSIPRGLLKNLMQETRSLQTILGIYRAFREQAGTLQRKFNEYELKMPKRLTYETMSKQFVKLCRERYPNPDKIRRLSGKLGVDKSTIGQILVFERFRDAVHKVSLKEVFKAPEQRDKLQKEIINLLEQLEDEYDLELDEMADREEIEESDFEFETKPKEG